MSPRSADRSPAATPRQATASLGGRRGAGGAPGTNPAVPSRRMPWHRGWPRRGSGRAPEPSLRRASLMHERSFGKVWPGRVVRRSRRRLWAAVLAAIAVLAIPGVATAHRLTAVSTNLGSVLPSTGQASVGTVQTLRVTRLTRDTQAGTSRVGDWFSIPRAGQANVLQRYFTVDYAKPADVTITNVRVDLLDYHNRVLLQTVTDARPGTPRVSVVDADTLQVRVTFDDRVRSQINSTPPPTDRIYYRVTLTGQRNNQQVTAEANSAPYFPLWRMPDALQQRQFRFGTRDPGGDDWSSQYTYNWLNSRANQALVTRINDISGEHGRNIGHATHYDGRKLDLYHV